MWGHLILYKKKTVSASEKRSNTYVYRIGVCVCVCVCVCVSVGLWVWVSVRVYIRVFLHKKYMRERVNLYIYIYKEKRYDLCERSPAECVSRVFAHFDLLVRWRSRGRQQRPKWHVDDPDRPLARTSVCISTCVMCGGLSRWPYMTSPLDSDIVFFIFF